VLPKTDDDPGNHGEVCYGDSFTWGYNPHDGTRYPFEQRWPGVLQHELSSGVRKILVIALPVLGEVSQLMGLFFNGYRALALEVKNVIETSLTDV
jgi:hypothetical protein